jgi:uncharacterized membrane protein
MNSRSRFAHKCARASALLILMGCAPGEQAATPARTEAPAQRPSIKDPWLDADERGVLLRAVGQEPGWDLEIDKSAMRLRYDYGQQELRVPAPSPARKGSTTTYEATSGSRRLRVVIEERPCADTMSGAEFSRSVTVDIDNNVLKGCGRPAGAAVPRPQ